MLEVGPGIEGRSCRLLLAKSERKLHEVRPAVQAVSTTRRLAQGAARRAEVDLQPMVISHVGNRHYGALSFGDKADKVPCSVH